jgi:hypothetical protein
MSAQTTKKREKAARMVAEDRLFDARIASDLGIAERTLERWKEQVDFQERVQEIVREYATRAMKHGLARVERRLTVLNEVHEKLLRVIAERAEDAELSGVPGGKTGLVVKTLRGIGRGAVEVFEVDTGTIRELRAIQQQAAEELGQHVQRISVTEGLSEEQMDARIAELMGKWKGSQK